MVHLIYFLTSRFDIGAEDPNPINPIAGQSVLTWLRDALASHHYTASEPSTEDWGWYIDVRGHGASYLVGASADADSSTPEVEWTVQVHKHRSVKEKILGRNKMAADDPLAALIERIVRADPQMLEVSVERDAR
jgi:hypothetical protein